MVMVDTPAGIVTVLSRTHRLTSHDVEGGATSESGQADGLVTDEHGRPLELLYGLVCRVGGIWEVHEEDFNEALDQSLQAYRRFLIDEDRPLEESKPFRVRTRASRVTAPPVTSPPISVESSPEGPPPVQPPPDNAYSAEHPPRRQMTVKGIAVLGIAAAIALFAVIGLRGEGPVTEVVANADLAVGEADCSERALIIVHVDITTNDKTTVSWSAGHKGKKLVKQRDLKFNAAGTRGEDLRFLEPKPSSGVISYEVVTNEPNKKKESTAYEFHCVPGQG